MNVEDRRGMRARGPALVGGGLGALVLTVLVMLLGGDPSQVNLDPSGGTGTGGAGAPRSAEENQLAEFASVVLADTEETWPQQLQGIGVRYEEPTMVLFTDAVDSGCGFAQSAVGPFYCPADGRVYLDLVFFDELAQQYGAPGDFAAAYVIAHEVGHHVQNLLGVAEKVQRAKQRDPRGANALSVRMELQADCFAGIWAHHAQRDRKILDKGDIEEGLRAASAIGDDTLQRRSQGRVVPESFTHGSAAQRVEWFTRGFEHGTLDACDTFGSRR